VHPPLSQLLKKIWIIGQLCQNLLDLRHHVVFVSERHFEADLGINNVSGSTEVHDQGAVFNLQTQVLDFPHTARELECCDFGPRVGLAYRVNDSLVIRSGYGMVYFEQSGITTPFTIPQFPFVQTVGQQSADNLTAAIDDFAPGGSSHTRA